ncbi:hypothetical protein ASE01_18630 [Nocardioides sp. Root190]|nr:hypothetical protein ASE01_18630 [Nocardioides sp. Root190]
MALADLASAPDTGLMLIALAIAILGSGALVALTMIGQRSRGSGLMIAALAGLAFPVAWTAWYLQDGHPFRSAPRV